MKKIINKLSVYGLLVMLLILTGCPVLTKNSIDNGSCDVPKWLPGTWQEMDKDGKSGSMYFLETVNKKGKLNWYETDDKAKPDRTKPKPVIMSKIGDNVFLSVYNQADDMNEEGYYLFELRKVSDDEMVLAGIKENKISYDATQGEIAAFLEANRNNAGIYDTSETSRYKKL